MQKKLKDIVEIIGGYTFRGAIIPDKKGKISVFQAKDLVQGIPFQDTSALVKISLDLPGYTTRLKKNDILLIARGMKSGSFRSTLFIADAENIVPSSSVHILRVTTSDVLPGYISHYLNSREGQTALTKIISGSYIGALSRKPLEEFMIPIPPLSTQEALLNLCKNIQTQQNILEKKKQLQEDILNGAFRTLILT